MILLFPGYHMPSKRYKNFLDHIRKSNLTEEILMYSPDLDISTSTDVRILAHSLGILQALLFCQKQNFQPSLIISLDGTYIDPEIIQEILPQKYQKDPQLAQIYQEYVDQNINLNLNIQLFRYLPIQNTKDPVHLSKDESHYQSVKYYSQEKAGHHPYNYPPIRNQIIQLLS